MRLLGARYRPPDLPPALILALNVVAGLLAILRGYDWLTVSSPDAFAVLLLELDVPLRSWGFALLVGGGGLLLALATSRHLLVWGAHITLCAIFVGLTWDIGTTVLRFGGGEHQLVAPIGGSIWHGVMAARTRSHPRRSSSPGTEEPCGQQPLR